MKMNPISILQNFMKGGGNPQNLVMKAVNSNKNPMIFNLIQMAKSGNTQELEQFARNYMQERGRDFDTEFNQFMNNFKQG